MPDTDPPSTDPDREPLVIAWSPSVGFYLQRSGTTTIITIDRAEAALMVAGGEARWADHTALIAHKEGR